MSNLDQLDAIHMISLVEANLLTMYNILSYSNYVFDRLNESLTGDEKNNLSAMSSIGLLQIHSTLVLLGHIDKSAIYSEETIHKVMNDVIQKKCVAMADSLSSTIH